MTGHRPLKETETDTLKNNRDDRPQTILHTSDCHSVKSKKGRCRDEWKGRELTRTIFSIVGPMGEKSDNAGPNTSRKAIIHEKCAVK